jgi:membrane protein required for colicin V production
MPFQLLDLILIGIMLISALLAMMRGFTREVLSLLAWGAAAVAAFFAIRSETLVNLAKQYLEPEIVAKIAVAGGVFLVVLVIVSLISVKIADFVLDSAAGAFDRSLGFVYGLARGLVLVAIAYLFYGWLMPVERQEDWVKNAQTLPYIKSTGELILSFVPPDIAETLTNTAILGNPEGQTTKPADPGSAADQPEGSEGYKKTETNGLDQLIQGTQGAQQPAEGTKQQPAFGSESNPN